MKLRRILLESDDANGGRSVSDIIETELPAESERKAYPAARRKIMRELDKQITQLLAGEIEEISIVAIQD